MHSASIWVIGLCTLRWSVAACLYEASCFIWLLVSSGGLSQVCAICGCLSLCATCTAGVSLSLCASIFLLVSRPHCTGGVYIVYCMLFQQFVCIFNIVYKKYWWTSDGVWTISISPVLQRLRLLERMTTAVWSRPAWCHHFVIWGVLLFLLLLLLLLPVPSFPTFVTLLWWHTDNVDKD